MPTTRTRQEAAKRQILGVFGETPPSEDGFDPADKSHVEAMLEDVETELQGRLQSLRADRDQARLDLKSAHSSAMVKLPTRVRHMTVADFDKNYNCRLLDLLNLSSKRLAKQLMAEANPENWNVR